MLSAAEFEILALSLKVALWGLAASLPLAVAVAFVLARKDFPGKTLFDAVVHMPLVLPPVVVGYALLRALRHARPHRRIAGRPSDRAHLPMDRCGARRRGHGFSADGARDPAFDRGRGSAAWNPRRARWAPGAGACSSRSRCRSPRRASSPARCSPSRAALGEFGATITFVSNIPGETRTLPLAIYTFTQVPGGDAQALRLSIFSVVLSLGALAFSEWLARRRHPADSRHA